MTVPMFAVAFHDLADPLDRMAALRRQMPWRTVTTDYRFVRKRGPATPGDLVAGRRQLIVYRHRLRPAYPAPCPGCAMPGDQVPHLSDLHARDTTLTFVSRVPPAEVLAFRARMGWVMRRAETTDSFNRDFFMGDHGPGSTVFIRDNGEIHQNYVTTGRGTEGTLTIRALPDMTAMGRKEQWQQAPDWVPQGAPCHWWRLHDRYGL